MEKKQRRKKLENCWISTGKRNSMFVKLNSWHAFVDWNDGDKIPVFFECRNN